MVKKILIANRGEIACRIMKTARRLGCKTVAVYSVVDANALHVAQADEAVCIGSALPSESYLRIDKIIEAARATGAEAIHPGYGFLSENPEFVEAIEAAGLTFIGPSAAAIRAMGLKDAAKAVMEQAGVPVVPGYHGEDQSDHVLAKEADRIGYPVLIKAVAGGGGKGMRRVEEPSQFADALASARNEAASAFGNSDVLIEKYIQTPRHIEVQVFGDGTEAIHLFERDCSLQRRHQKVIEEAPAPGMTEAVRAAMGQAAVRAAKAIGYSGAGTVEFIVDASDGIREDGFWFMEMNTRLQVEHPVTEAITGLDLVEMQLRVASGEPLMVAQEDVAINGHAFEARIYAEDVPAGFLPAIGNIEHLSFGDGVRVDTGVQAGDRISPFYDPMIAKVISHAQTREAALTQMARALEHTEIAGTVTNIAFLSNLCRHPTFQQGQMDTGLIDRDLDQLIEASTLTPRAVGAALLTYLAPHPQEARGFTIWDPLWQEAAFDVDGEVFTIPYQLSDQTVRFKFETQVYELDLSKDPVRLEGQSLPRSYLGSAGITVFDNPAIEVGVIDPLDRDVEGRDTGNSVISPMPGLIATVMVEAGQWVQEGDVLVVLEAMKMEHRLCASKDGHIEEVLCAQGEQVEAGAQLIMFAQSEADST